MRMFDPPHPGTVLRDYLANVSVTAAAGDLGVTRATLSRILNGNAGISAEMALRLSEALGTTPELWIGMQSQYDLWQASKNRRRKSSVLSRCNYASCFVHVNLFVGLVHRFLVVFCSGARPTIPSIDR